MIAISIIIPVYNAEKQLRACLQSVATQTIADYEIILVDDHGSDESMQKARVWADELGIVSKMRYVSTPKNGGPGAARNVGLDVAQGDYIAFLDSDDTIESSMLEKMLYAAKSSQSDLCYCQAWRETEQKRELLSNPIVAGGLWRDEDKRMFLTHFKTYLWTFIYRREFIESYAFRFPLERSSEDSNFLIKVLLLSKRIASVQEPLYHYKIQTASLTTTRNETRYQSKIASFDALVDELCRYDEYKDFASEIEYLYVKKGFTISCMDYLSNASMPDVQVLKAMSTQLAKRWSKWKENSYMRKDKIVYMLCWMFLKMPRMAVVMIPRLLKRMNVPL